MFARERVAAKQSKADSRQAIIESRTATVQEMTAEVDDGDAKAEVIRRAVADAEDQGAALGVQINEASQRLSNEQSLVDRELEKLPILEKIGILSTS